MRTNRQSSAANRQSPGTQAQGSPLLWFLIISAVAFLLRLIHLLELRHNDPLFLSPQMDALYHHQWALAIAAGKEFIADAYFRAPLYPHFLGLVYKLFSANQMVVRIIQSLIGSATCGLTYLLARRLVEKHQIPNPKSQTSTKVSNPKSAICNRPAEGFARAAGFVMAAYPLAIWYDGELQLEGLLTFLLMLGFVLLYRSRDTDRQWWLPGIVFGLASLARPNVLVFLAVLPVWLFLERGRIRPTCPTRRTALARLALVWGAVALVILPVTIRNYVASRQFVPIAWQAGTNFYIGNSPQSDGMTAILPGTRGSWWGGFDDVKRLAEQAMGRPLTGAEIDRYWLGKGLEFWRQQPGKALGLLARKAFRSQALLIHQLPPLQHSVPQVPRRHTAAAGLGGCVALAQGVAPVPAGLPLRRGVLALVRCFLRHQPLPDVDRAGCGSLRGHGTDGTSETYGGA
jgi:hypothetical protein